MWESPLVSCHSWTRGLLAGIYGQLGGLPFSFLEVWLNVKSIWLHIFGDCWPDWRLKYKRHVWGSAFPLKIFRFSHHATGSDLCKMAVLPKLSRKKCLFGLSLWRFSNPTLYFGRRIVVLKCCYCNSDKDCEMRDLKEPIFEVNLNFSCCADDIFLSEICISKATFWRILLFWFIYPCMKFMITLIFTDRLQKLVIPYAVYE